MAGVAFAVEGDGVGFATESYAASALYTTLASLSGALWRIRRASGSFRRDINRYLASNMVYEQKLRGLHFIMPQAISRHRGLILVGSLFVLSVVPVRLVRIP